jgi:hypothetical protein
MIRNLKISYESEQVRGTNQRKLQKTKQCLRIVNICSSDQQRSLFEMLVQKWYGHSNTSKFTLVPRNSQQQNKPQLAIIFQRHEQHG